MKKKITTTVAVIGILLGFYTTAVGQSYIGAKIGGFWGTTSSEIVGDVLPIEWKLGTEMGLFSEFPITNKWSVVGGLQYSRRGFSMQQGTTLEIFGLNLPVSARADVNLNYLDIPIQLKYTHTVGNINVYGTTGAALGYAANGNIETRANLIFDLNLTNTPINFSDNNISRMNTSFIIGSGIEYPLSNGKLFFDARYNHGMNDLLGNGLIDLNVRNKGFSLGFGYAMAL